MTWYASQILASGAPHVVEEVRRLPVLADNLFRVANPLKYDWSRPDVAHEMPEEGLLFVRPICEPDDFMEDWVDEPFISATAFAGLELPELAIQPSVISQHDGRDVAFMEPFVDALRTAKLLSQRTGSAVAFYYCFFWGGYPEIEFSWVFGQSERALIRIDSNENVLLDFHGGGVEQRNEDVLVEVLKELGCPLPSPYFAPHTRGFTWDEYRV